MSRQLVRRLFRVREITLHVVAGREKAQLVAVIRGAAAEVDRGYLRESGTTGSMWDCLHLSLHRWQL